MLLDVIAFLYFFSLGAFAKLRKAIIRLVMCVCPSVNNDQFDSQCTDFHEILYLIIFRKFAEENYVALKFDKNNRYLT